MIRRERSATDAGCSATYAMLCLCAGLLALVSILAAGAGFARSESSYLSVDAGSLDLPLASAKAHEGNRECRCAMASCHEVGLDRRRDSKHWSLETRVDVLRTGLRPACVIGSVCPAPPTLVGHRCGRNVLLRSMKLSI